MTWILSAWVLLLLICAVTLLLSFVKTPIVVYHMPLGRWRGMVLYPFVLFRGPKELVSQQMYDHEMALVYQVRRDGWLKFYWTYLKDWRKYGHRQIPYEVEARRIAERSVRSRVTSPYARRA